MLRWATARTRVILQIAVLPAFAIAAPAAAGACSTGSSRGDAGADGGGGGDAALDRRCTPLPVDLDGGEESGADAGPGVEEYWIGPTTCDGCIGGYESLTLVARTVTMDGWGALAHTWALTGSGIFKALQ